MSHRGDSTHFDITVSWKSRRFPAQADWLRSIAVRAARELAFQGGTLSIAVVGSARMALIHRNHCGVRGPTDVITFDLSENARGRRLDGEIVVCADVAAVHSGDRLGRKPFLNELALYVVHGMLHLAGYDDRDAASFRVMHQREDRIMQRLRLRPARIKVVSRAAGRRSLARCESD